MVKQMQNNVLTQTGTVENPNLLPEDEKRPNGLHSLEGVAYLLQKDASELDEIEVLEGVGAFHKSRDGKGAYLVNMEDMSCSCPGYRFRGHCRHVAHVEERIQNEATSRPRKMSKDELAARKARIDARNRQNAAKRAAKKADRSREAFRPNCPDEIEAAA